MLAFLDLETTGLEPELGSILELAFVLTDDNLGELGVYETLVRPMHLRGFEAMDDYVREMHTKSGLLDVIFHFSSAAPIERAEVPRCGEVEETAINWLKDRETKEGLKKIPLAGNSVHFDRAWLKEHMPDLEALFSHRNADVSSVNEFAKRWAPSTHAERPGVRPDGTIEPAHRALADVRQSIETAKYYRRTLFAPALTMGML